LQIIIDKYEATSVAPWVTIIESRDQTCGSSFIMTGIAKDENMTDSKHDEGLYIIGATNADIDFTAQARQDIPALIAEVKRLNKKTGNE
jgi:hypothetical protein